MRRRARKCRKAIAWLALPAAMVGCAAPVWAQSSQPANVYLFPAGGQRGARVEASIEGENVTTLCDFHLRPGRGVRAPAQARDRKVVLEIAPDAPLGPVSWRLATAQGGTGSRAFIIGEHPEIVESEPGPRSTKAEPVTLPVTVNGRLNPDGDVDLFSFDLAAGQPFSAEVMAARIGGPIDTNCFIGQFGNPPDDPTYKQIDAVLELRGPDGRVAASAEDTFGLDPALGIVAPRAGRYVLSIRHVALAGMPQFVYRLTLAPHPLVTSAFPAGGRRGEMLTTRLHGPGMAEPTAVTLRLGGAPAEARLLSGSRPFPLETSDLPEVLETEPNDRPDEAGTVALPAVLNGRFLQPGDVDVFRISLKKGEHWRFEAVTDRIGNPGEVGLAVLDAAGVRLAGVDVGPLLHFAAPADGEYFLQIREASMSRLGERLVYRLEVTRQPPDFAAVLKSEFVDLDQGGRAALEVSVRRLGGFAGPVRVTVEGLPEGVEVAELVIAPGQEKGNLSFAAGKECRSGSVVVRVVCRADAGGSELVRVAAAPAANPAEPSLNAAPRSFDDLLLTVRYPAPFKIEADDSYLFLNLGSIHPAKIYVTREAGFEGPIAFSMADRQPRNPYGITFERVVWAGSEKEVFVPMHLPQGPRGNEVVRCYVKAEAVVRDRDGREWHLLQTSPKQVVSRVIAPLLSLEVEPDAVRVSPGTDVAVRFRLGRTAESRGEAQVRLIASPGVRGVSMERVHVPAGASEATGVLRLGADAASEVRELWFEVTSRRSSGGQVLFYRAPLVFDLVPARR